jgi:transposase-like protein
MSVLSSQSDDFPLRPYTIAQLADIYGVCKRTVRKWMKPFSKEIGPRQGHFYTVAQVKIIIDKIDLPKVRHTPK